MDTSPMAHRVAENSLTFHTHPWLVVLSIAIVVAGIVLAGITIRRHGFRRDVLALESLRVAAMIAIAILLHQPEWVEATRAKDLPVLGVLLDRSSSMNTEDVPIAPEARGSGVAYQSRAEAIEPLGKSSFWNGLEANHRVVVSEFPGPQGIDATDLAAPLNRILEESSNLMGVLLVSDGDWNAGEPPASVASRFRTRGIPILTLPVGSPVKLPDLELLSVDTPTFGIVGKGLRVPFTIESSLPRDTAVTVSVTTSEGEVLTREVRVRAMARTTDAVVWVPKKEGDFTLSVEVPVQPEESNASNNQATSPISIRQEKLQVLVVDTYPRWEYRYLRNALSRDPGVDVACLLFHPDLDKVGGGNRDYISEFPPTLEALARYDVVFLGDVGVGPGQLTTEQCELLRGLVEFQAGGLVFIPGSRGYQASLATTALEPLFPVVLDERRPLGIGDGNPMRMELTESGRRSVLTRLADTPEENVEVWSQLPGFQWHAAVARAKAGSEVLAVHESASGVVGRMPLLATKTMGTGKILFMGTDGVWRWRRGVEDKYHYRFWGQVVRWMAYQRNMAKGQSMRFYFSPDAPNVSQTLTLRANIMQPSGEPLSDGEVTARIESPSGRAEVVRLSSRGEDSWGAYEGSYQAAEAGSHRVILACKQLEETLESSFFVQGTARERIGSAARPKVLEELSRLTRGKTLAIEAQEEWLSALSGLPAPPPSLRRVSLWAHPITLGVLLTALTVFWIGRKAAGLI